MDWHIAPDDPIYAQLAKQIRLGIVSGEYVPGERLPPVRELALSAGVNPNTMQRALTELEREGMVFPQRTAGRFVTEDAALIAAARETLAREHGGLPHGGFVIRSGETGGGNQHIIEYRLQLDSNPEFTGSVLVAFARAAYRMAKEGQSGAKTVFDIAPAYLSPQSGEELRAHML